MKKVFIKSHPKPPNNSRSYYQEIKYKNTYCVQLNEFNQLSWYFCSKDGEPDYEIINEQFIIKGEQP